MSRDYYIYEKQGLLIITKGGAEKFMKLDASQIMPIINNLLDMVKTNVIDVEILNNCIDLLETIKTTISSDDEFVIDSIDETQDYLYYLISTNETTISSEIKEDIIEVIDNLKGL